MGYSVYNMTFTGTAGDNRGLTGLDPNATWGLVLWNNGDPGTGNELVGWSLDVTAVPEPIIYALACFGLVFVGGTAGRFYLKSLRTETLKS